MLSLERLMRSWGLPLWMIWPGAEPHLQRRYMSLWCSFRRGCWLPLPQGILGLRLFLDTLFYWEILWIIFGSVMLVSHLSVLCYSAVYDGPLRGHYYPILVAICCLELVRVLCCCIILGRVRDLRVVWWSRPIVGELVQLLRCACWQVERLASCSCSCAMFVAIHVMYNETSCGSSAPMLCRYMSVIILCFLSLLGPNVVLLICTAGAFLCVCCTTETRLAGVFINEAIGNYSVPLRVLDKLKEETWSQLKSNYATSSPLYSGVLDATICSICLCEYQPEELIRTLPCGHLFHSVCITRWFRSRTSCPLRCHVNFVTGRFELSRRDSTDAHQSALEEDGEGDLQPPSNLVLHVSEHTASRGPSGGGGRR